MGADWHPAASEDEVLARLSVLLAERVAGLDPAHIAGSGAVPLSASSVVMCGLDVNRRRRPERKEV
jgi:hypothetical protein